MYALGIITGILLCIFLKKSQTTVIYKKKQDKIENIEPEKGEIIKADTIHRVTNAKSPTELL